MSTPKIGDLEAYRVAVYKRAGFFELNLACRAAFCLKCSVKSGFCLGFDNVVSIVGFVYEHTQTIGRYFNHTATDSKVIKFAIGIALVVANSNSTWCRHAHKRFVPRKHRNFTSCGR